MDTLEFRTSSYSGAQGNCVEVADTPSFHALRDTKTPEQAPLPFPQHAWAAFLADIKTGTI